MKHPIPGGSGCIFGFNSFTIAVMRHELMHCKAFFICKADLSRDWHSSALYMFYTKPICAGQVWQGFPGALPMLLRLMPEVLAEVDMP